MPTPALSETTIVNRALVRLGAKPITDISNASTDVAASAGLLYYELRDALLRKGRWNFARRFAALAALPNAPLGLALLPDPDYAGQITYTGAYQLPADYLRLSAVSPYTSHWRIVGNTILTDAPATPVTVALIGTQPPNSDGSDNLPAGNQAPGSFPPIGIEYIARIDDVTKFDSVFIQILAKSLAHEMCFGVNAHESLRKELAGEVHAELADALAVEGMEQWPEQLYDTVLTDVRYGYASAGGQASSLFGS